MINQIKTEKDALRAEYKKYRADMDPEVKKLRDDHICRCAVGLVSYRYADYVLMYSASFGEIDIKAIADDALSRGKMVAYPRCDKSSYTMKYHFIDSTDELVPDAYGIPEPPEAAPVYDPGRYTGSAVCYVPGLVFDVNGYRLGYGKGYYDRFISGFRGCSIGVIYSDFILKNVPIGRFDTKVDILLTEKGVRMTGEG